MGSGESTILKYKDKQLLYNKKTNTYYWVSYINGKETIKLEVQVIITDVYTPLNAKIPLLIKFNSDEPYWMEREINDNIVFTVKYHKLYTIVYQSGGTNFIVYFQTCEQYIEHENVVYF